jgi:hypothetical protein
MKYLILSTVSFTLIIALYDLVIKRVKILRFLFGMKVKPLFKDKKSLFGTMQKTNLSDLRD